MEHVQGTSISKDKMQQLIEHSAVINGKALTEKDNDKTVCPKCKCAPCKCKTEGVQGTSPTPGQDNIFYVPPTTSDVTGGGMGGEDPTKQKPGDPQQKAEDKMDNAIKALVDGFLPDADDIIDEGKNDGKDKDGKDKKGEG